MTYLYEYSQSLKKLSGTGTHMYTHAHIYAHIHIEGKKNFMEKEGG